MMNDEERELDLQLGDALAEIESLKAERDALKAALAQPEQEPDDLMIAYLSGVHAGKKEAKAQPDEDEIIIQYHEATIKRLEKRIEELAAQPEQEPVAWLEPEWGEKICPEVGYEVTMTSDHPKDLCWIPLYPKKPWGVAARRRDVYTPTPTPLSHWLDRKEGDKT